MAPRDDTSPSDQHEMLKHILSTVQSIREDYQHLSVALDSIQGQLNILSGVKQAHDVAGRNHPSKPHNAPTQPLSVGDQQVATNIKFGPNAADSSLKVGSPGASEIRSDGEPLYGRKHSATATSRIILTTYPGQSGIDPLPMNWGHVDALERGPVVVSRSQSTVRRRNAIGAHGGSYSVYHALAVASKHLDVDHKPDFTNSEPAVTIGPFPQWKKIVSIDPLGHLSPWLFSDLMRDEDIHIRPSIAITKAHMKLPELEQSVRDGRIVPDKKICLNEFGELAVTKFAVEPVWFLPGVAERFGIDEGTLRRSLFENTGGSFPELITRGDIKLFLPPIGGLTVYCFGDPARMADPNVKLALRVHDECNG
ncbi:hypothetical protein IMSHALPRED_000261 [Imshaugia aleurites]|uniref:GTP cyclohydrolase N-terminal domain-containing protein n=1 Tax=Imshaugia aleurites TaxID=172621 RepID=A0A8H3EE15_9LECA|nr:hypothetical protein IMSHALPRED_000261 [Imshaugia aleurites]